MPNWFIIADVDELEFTKLIAPHEMIKPIRRVSNPHLGKLVLQGNIANCGPKYDEETKKPHWNKTTNGD